MRFISLLFSILLIFSLINCQDLDGDGFSSTNQFPGLVDCCDTIFQCPNPFSVNPGAAEIPNNGIDDNCNGLIDESDSCPSTPNPVSQTFTFQSAANTSIIPAAFDLNSCSLGNDDVQWGVLSKFQVVLLLANGTQRGVNGPFDLQFGVLNNFGEIAPVAGRTMFVMSTGQARNPNNPGYNAATYGNTSLGSSVVSPPSNWASTKGGNVPLGSANCPPAKRELNNEEEQQQQEEVEEENNKEKRQLPYYDYYNNQRNRNYNYVTPYDFYYQPSNAPRNVVYDSARVRFTLRQPTNYNSFAFNVRFGTSSKQMPPIHFNQPFNDYFVILKETGTFVPPDFNIAKTQLNQDIYQLNGCENYYTSCYSATNGKPNNCIKGTKDTLGASYTGTTSWQYTGGSAAPGEVFNVSLILWDTGNALVDSTVLIDDFRLVSERPTGSTPYGYFRTSDIELKSVAPNTNVYKQGVNTILTYTIVVRNLGPEPTNNVYVSFTTPVALTYVSATNATCSSTGSAIYSLRRCSVNSGNTLAVGSTFTLTVNFNVNPTYTGILPITFVATCSSVNKDNSNDFKPTTVTVVN